MNLLPADYVVCAIVLAFSVTGLFRGLSGTLAFLVATVASAGFTVFSWRISDGLLSEIWMRVGSVFVIALLVFGIVRHIVRKVVNGLLAQPADSIFGFISGVIVGALLVVVWAYSGFHTEYSYFATFITQTLFKF